MTDYSAKTAYQNSEAPRGYMARRHYASWLGRARQAAEWGAVKKALMSFPGRHTWLDCPCGNGRWMSALAAQASEITASDISQEMLDYARDHFMGGDVSCKFVRCSAEAIDLPDNSVDMVFSFALLKHLPHEAQDRVVAEFARVARKGVICTFPLTGLMSRVRAAELAASESYPRSRSSVIELAERCGLKFVGSQRCSTLLGMEHLFWFCK